MNTEIFRKFDDIPVKEMIPGFYSKFIHTENNTINFIEMKAGCVIPLHKHVHEQSSFVLEGRFEMTVEEETRILEPGFFCMITPNLLHGGTALTDCKLLDIFSPVREDYKSI